MKELCDTCDRVGALGKYQRIFNPALITSKLCPVHLFQTKVKGLSVAFLDGTYEAEKYTDTESSTRRYYTEADVAKLKKMVRGWEGDIDVLLTCEWPAGILNGLARGTIDGN